MQFELVTPEKLAYSHAVDMVEVPGELGDFGVLPGHAPFMSIIRPGVVSIHESGEIKRLFVNGGYAEVNPEGCTVLAEHVRELDGVSKEVALRELEEAEKVWSKADNDAEKARAQKLVDIAGALVAALH